MSQGRTRPIVCHSANDRIRRVSPTAARPVEGLLSEATAGIQLESSELVFMPLRDLAGGLGAGRVGWKGGIPDLTGL
jgi:hypothetical protein